jgi:mycothiol synthase
VPALPEGFTLRPPRKDDVPAITALVRRCEEADEGEAERTEEDIEIAQRSLDLERDVRVVEDGSGRLVATYAIRPRLPVRIQAFVAVDPGARGLGIGTVLADAVDERARELVAAGPATAPVALSQHVGELNAGARSLLERHGYRWARRFWIMEIELDGDVPEPEWSEGIRLETMADGVPDRAVYEAMEDAFADHWGFTPHDYDEWRAWGVERDSFDPTLWFIAREGDEVAGAALCAVQEGVPWVHVLGVRRPWRRRGIGLALLRQSFREFRRRGYRRASLGVDSENPTGATRLYERAGMRVVRQSDAFEKELQPT